MIKTILNIEGMMCPRCEKHMNEAIEKTFHVEKVTSSHSKKLTEIISEAPLDEELIQSAVASAGYTLKGVSSEPYEKKGFKLFG